MYLSNPHSELALFHQKEARFQADAQASRLRAASSPRSPGRHAGHRLAALAFGSVRHVWHFLGGRTRTAPVPA